MPRKKSTKQNSISKITGNKIIQNLSEDQLVALLMSSPDIEKVLGEAAVINDYPDDPVEFIEKVFGVTLWGKQIDIVRSVESHQNTVVSSGHSSGKSFLSAALACYWMTKKENAVVITLAPTFRQVQDVLWRYIRHFARDANLPGKVYDTPRWEISEVHYAAGFSPKKTSEEEIAGTQGYHAPNLLVIMDEGAGMPRIMFNAIRNLATGASNRVLTIGNPIGQSGAFWDACNSDTWNYIHISCLEHPNVIQKKEVIPGAVSYEWVRGMVIDHTIPCSPNTPGAVEFDDMTVKPDPIFQARVLGIAPEDSDDQLIPSSWVLSSQSIELQPIGEKVIALDPARQGGDTATMICRHGGKILWIERRIPRSRDIGSELAGWIKMALIDNEVTQCLVDEIGSGASVIDASRREGLPVVGVNFSSPASQKNRFVNIRSEAYWRVREAMKHTALQIPEDDLLSSELLAIKYFYDHRGRIQIEDKRDIRHRINRSPDTADALAISFALSGAPLPEDQELSEMFRRGQSELVSGNKWAINDVGSYGGRWGVAKQTGRRRWRIK